MSKTFSALRWAPVVLLAGCNLVGPTALATAPLPYNQAIAKTRDEQMLLNLVRLRYRDNPLFLDVGSLSTQYQFDSSLSGSSTFFESGSDNEPVFSLGGAVKWSEKPTITYTPLRGEAYIKQMMTPISLPTIALLTRSGWSISRVMLCTAKSVNDLPNAPRASGPTPGTEPIFADCHAAFAQLRELQLARVATMSFVQKDDRIDAILRFLPGSEDHPATAQLRETLGLPGGSDSFTLVSGYRAAAHDPDKELSITTRSMMGILFYLCHAVEVPPEHEAAGLVTRTVRADGTPFDWREVTGKLMRVRSSASRPKNAYIAVPYRGAWFYIADNDLNSKSTYALMTLLFALQSGERRTTAPALTLPIGG